MRILITGGAGFIGSHIVDRYLEDGHKVMVIDDLSSGVRENVNPSASFEMIDIAQFEPLERVFADFRPEIINHHAAQIDVRKSVADPLFDARVNIIGSLNLLELARRYKIRRFIYASSGGCVYGDTRDLPVKETAPVNPLSPYGVAKVAVENYLKSFSAMFGLEYVVLRYSNVYGPRQNTRGEAGVVAIFIGRIAEGKPCIIYGDGKQTRDYIYIGDVVEANYRALSSPVGIYNIGTSKETSVNELVEIFSQILNSRVERVYEKPRTGELFRNSLDINLARKELNWQPKIDIFQGIRLTYEYFNQNRE